MEFTVEGTPKGYSNNGEEKWRKAIAKKVDSLENTLKYTEMSKFKVEITFFLLENSHDLDNLIKPVLDTLFKGERSSIRFSELTGKLIKYDDRTVYRLIAKKEIVSDFSGAKITIDII